MEFEVCEILEKQNYLKVGLLGGQKNIQSDFHGYTIQNHWKFIQRAPIKEGITLF